MRVAVLSVALSLALFASPGWAQKAGPAAAQASADDPEANEAAVSKVPLDEIRRFVAVYNAVKQAYVDPVEDKKLMHSAVRGLLSDLDPHSTYFDKEDAEAFDEQATGAYDGIGVELLQQQDNTLKVIAPIDDTPAARAGIRAGDVIVAIDGKPIDASKAMEPLRGESGSKVVLTIMRDKTPKPFDVTLQRETIRVASVRSKLLEPGYGYIRISTFQADTGADFQKNLKQLQAGGKLRGLVLDLRSNPGGLLTSAVQVADDLLDKGNIVSTRGRISISDAKFDATPGDLLSGAPVVVLVDAGSASASEVLAGALRDNKRARIIGSRTFGKGSVQTVLPLDNGDSVKLTTARYYTPSGKSIQASGIVPDVLLTPEPQPGDADVPASLTDYSEATLPGHLRGDDEGEEGYSAGDVLPGDGPIAEALAELKQPGSVAKAQAARKAKAQAAQKAKPAKTGADPKPAAARPATTDKPTSAEPAGKAKPATAPAAPAEPVQPAPPKDTPASTEPGN
ncbi:S41 family peptidase [Xanthomonas perforans]|uniref:S41 family peptidase n=1 Tax=Xanthomonas euvesicatoria TaxID=456327 RepID=A0AAX4FJ11_XANEU|nr:MULTISPECIES: S41 family peptidase [Xanthomonas]MBV6859002.1 S41 family peptidase [Xanthomonas campestris pv. zingibericola]MCP3040149.1 S41 family peptidase [Xanthomonas euvesicatoria pv. allii]MCP3052114.1 S41 family peptidase [Xanthomonas euvesicatoria pv. allii]MDH4906105.1 S41 family peptidase [Xanthomonas euvesicatoria]PWH25334.1 peptidase S41 [Xanthomonas perforans]